MTYWSLVEAAALCCEVENISVAFGCHVALTGGTLYKKGSRKDVDLLFYNIRQVDKKDREGLLTALETIGFIIGPSFGWVQKATYLGKPVDLFFPEDFPSSSSALPLGESIDMHFQTRDYWAERAHRTSLLPLAAPEPGPLAWLAVGALRLGVLLITLAIVGRAVAAGMGS